MNETAPHDMNGKVVAITGANTGIGLATATALARRGATVLACGRDDAKLERARASIQTANPGARVETLTADLARIDQVRGLAAAISERTDRLDVLINNAGVGVDRRIETEDGLELTFAVNVMAPYLLATSLRPLLEASAPARIVTVSSAVHTSVATLDLDDLQSTKSYRWSDVYARAKLASILVSNELARRLDGTGVTSNALHPGVIATDFGGDGDLRGGNALLFRVLKWFLPGPEAGARTSLHLATSPELEGVSGRYFDGGAEKAPSALAQDASLGQELWERLERISRA
jgi:NAD(P)-dependent dehydrogenase (short-subunit alcohol dehydrogenase family)